MKYLKKYYKYKLKQLGGSQFNRQQDKLLFILTCCAQNKFYEEVKPFINLNKTFRTDIQLWSAMNKTTYSKNCNIYRCISTTERDKTLLMAAVVGGNIDHIRFLLPFSNIHAKTSFTINRQSVMDLAIERGNMDIINLLDKSGTLDISLWTIKNKLLDAIDDNNLPLFTFLINKVDVKTISYESNDFGNLGLIQPIKDNETLLMLASKYGRLDMVKLLIEHGVDVNSKFEIEAGLKNKEKLDRFKQKINF